MAKLISEINKVDIALTPQSLAAAGATGEYFSIGMGRKALFVWEVEAMAAAGTSIAQVMQAKDASGTDAKQVTNNTATIINATNAAAVLLDNSATHVAAEEYIINGIKFTAAATDGGATSRTYAIGDNAAASSTNLAAKINDPAIGVPGVTASVSTNDMLLVATEPGETTITVTTSAGAKGVPLTQRAIGYVECDESFLDLADGYDHVAIRITPSAAQLTGAICVRSDNRYSPNKNQVAAAKVDVEP